MSTVGAVSVAVDAVGAGLFLRGYSVGMLQKENGASDWTRCPGAFGSQAWKGTRSQQTRMHPTSNDL